MAKDRLDKMAADHSNSGLKLSGKRPFRQNGGRLCSPVD
jgi:hypothetical protein